MLRVRKVRYLVPIFLSILLILTIFSTSSIASFTTREGRTSDSLPSQPPLSAGRGSSVQAEQDNVDSFDVNPKSGRWNVSLDEKTDDLVTDSQLRLTTVENATGSDSEYLMDRGLRKLDSKVEFRLSGDGGGNQTEFFRDERGDAADFEEGDKEGFVNFFTPTTSVENGLLKVEADSNFDGVRTATIIINQQVYSGIKYRIIANTTVDLSVEIRSGGVSIFFLRFDLTTSWQTIEHDWEDFTARSSDDERLIVEQIVFLVNTPTGTETFFLEFVEVPGNLDFATHVEGEIEDTWDWEVDNNTESWTDMEDVNVSDGFVRMSPAVNVTGDFFTSPAAMNIDSSLFEILTLRINSSDATIEFNFQADFGAGFVVIGDAPAGSLSNALTIFTFDLTADSDWDGSTAQQIRFRFSETDGFLDGDEFIFIDYVLLLGHWADVDSTIGLFDTDSDSPLLNVSLHFTSNNSHPTSSQVSTIEVELLDQDGEIAFNHTEVIQIHGLFLRGKITYDILTTELSVVIDHDNRTRIFRVVYPKDFTIQSARVPALFALGKPPFVFVSTYTPSISWQTVFIDFIDTPYMERDWRHEAVATGTDVISDTPLSFVLNGSDAVGTSSWLLTVPRLDGVSGLLQWDKNASASGSGRTSLIIFGVDGNDGDLHSLVRFSSLYSVNDFTILIETFTPLADRVIVLETKTVGLSQPSLGFSFRLEEERTRAIFQVDVFWDITNASDVSSFVLSIDDILETDLPDLSQEFVIEIDYSFGAGAAAPAFISAVFVDFDLIARESFSGMGHLIPNPPRGSGGGGNDPISIIIRGFVDLVAFPIVALGVLLDLSIAALGVAVVGAVGLLGVALGLIEVAVDAATTAIGVLQTAIEVAVTALKDALEAALTALGVLLEAAIEALEPFMTLISDAVDALWTLFIDTLSDIVDELITLASSFVDFFFDVLELLIPLLITFLGTILGAVFGLIADIVFFVWDALALPNVLEILDFVLVGLGQFIGGIPSFLSDLFTFLAGISAIFSVLGFILFFIIPIAQGADEGEFISHMFSNMGIDISFGWTIMGFGGKVPIVVPWLLVTIFTLFVETPFFDFF